MPMAHAVNRKCANGSINPPHPPLTQTRLTPNRSNNLDRELAPEPETQLRRINRDGAAHQNHRLPNLKRGQFLVNDVPLTPAWTLYAALNLTDQLIVHINLRERITYVTFIKHNLA